MVAAVPACGEIDFLQLVGLGISAVIGAGVFVITGVAAARYAGGAIVISFAVAAVLCCLVGICFARCVVSRPDLSGAPAHIRAGFGDLFGLLAGFALLTEFGFAIATVAVGLAGYLGSLLPVWPGALPHWLAASPVRADIPAAACIAGVAALAALGVRQSLRLLLVLVVVKLLIIALLLIILLPHISWDLMTPFVPPRTGGAYGWQGIASGTVVVFSAYLGFDVISAAAPQARDAVRNVPRAIFLVLAIAATLYGATALALTGTVPFRALDVPDPALAAVDHAVVGGVWLHRVVAIGAVVGLVSVLLSLLVAVPRMIASLATGLPGASFLTDPGRALWVLAVGTALLAAFAPMHRLAELIGISALVLYLGVSARALQLRAGPIAVLTFVSCLVLLMFAPRPGLVAFLAALMLIGGVLGFTRSQRPRLR